jgi:hypothetical protein
MKSPREKTREKIKKEFLGIPLKIKTKTKLQSITIQSLKEDLWLFTDRNHREREKIKLQREIDQTLNENDAKEDQLDKLITQLHTLKKVNA